MRSQLWAIFTQIKYAELYSQAYHHKAALFSDLTSSVAFIFSVLCGATWLTAIGPAWLWLLLMLLFQIIEALKPRFPFINRLPALKYYIPEIRMFAVYAESKWNEADIMNEEQLKATVNELRGRFAEIECKYFGSDTLPDIKSIKDKTEPVYTKYFHLNHDVMEGGEPDARQKTYSPAAS